MRKFSYFYIRLVNYLFVLFILFNGNSVWAESGTELRCGWFENSSPNNASFTDKDGEWTVSIQGGYEAKGNWPTFKKTEWVKIGTGNYGYGCACIKVMANKDSQEIIEIIKADSKPLLDCKHDKKLKAR